MTSKVGKQDGSAAANDPGSTSIGAAMSAAAAAAGPHEPATVQAMYLSDSETSPLLGHRYRTPPGKRPTSKFQSPGRYLKRTEATAQPLNRAKHRKIDVPLDQSNQKAIEALTTQVRYDEEFMKEIGRILDHLVINYVELKNEQVRGNKWHAENTSRILGVESRVNEEFKDAKTYINEKFKEANAQAAANTFEKMQVHEGRLAALDAAIQEQRDDLEKHQSYLQKMHAAKPEEEKTFFTLFKTLEAEIVKLDASKAEQMHVQAALHETKGMLNELNRDIRQDHGEKFNSIAATLSQTQTKVEDIARGLVRVNGQLDSNTPPVPNVPEGHGRPARWRNQAHQFSQWSHDRGCGDECEGGEHDKTGQWRGGSWNDCHCEHVAKLFADMNTARLDIGKLQASRTPFIQPGTQRSSEGHPSGAPDRNYGSGPNSPPGAPQDPINSPVSLPLTLGPNGTVNSGRIFDDRVATQPEFAFKSIKQGYAWKTKALNYMISKVPAMKQIMHWAEREENVITPERLQQAIGDGLCIYDRDGNVVDHTKSLDSAVWGFLSNCTSGEAEVMFRQAEVCEGIDAWRRIIRLLDNGRSIRVEQLRNEIRMIRAYPIKTLEAVTVGVAEYENKINDFVEAGGRRPPEDELKSDLNAILPNELGNHLTVRVTDHGQSYQQFRDFVIYTCAQLLMRNKRLPPIHHVDEGGAAQEGYADNDEEGFIDKDDYEGLIAAVDRHHRAGRKGGGKGGFRKTIRKGSGTGTNSVHAVDADTRPGRRCTNCGGEHPAHECKKAIVDRDQRPCWTCNKVGHLGANCPMRKPPLKTVVEQNQETDNRRPRFAWNVNDPDDIVDVHGFKTVTKGGRPRPHVATMGMHLANAFTPLGAINDEVLKD